MTRHIEGLGLGTLGTAFHVLWSLYSGIWGCPGSTGFHKFWAESMLAPPFLAINRTPFRWPFEVERGVLGVSGTCGSCSKWPLKSPRVLVGPQISEPPPEKLLSIIAEL